MKAWSPQKSVSTSGPSKSWRRRLVDHVRSRLWLMVALVLVLMALYVVAGRQLMRWVPEFRQPLVEQLEQHLGLAIEIDHLSGEMDGFTPVFTVENIKLKGDAGNDPFSLKTVQVALDLIPSLLHRTVRIQRLYLSGIQLNVEQGEDGRFNLAGLQLLKHSINKQMPVSSQERGTKRDALKKLLDILYHQKRLEISGLSLHLKANKIPALYSHNVQLLLVNNGQEHRIALNAQMETETSRKASPLDLQMRLHLLGDAYSLEQLRGKLWMTLTGEQMQDWVQPWIKSPYQLEKLSGGIKSWAWMEQGKIVTAVTDLQINSLRIRQEQIEKPLQVDDFSARTWMLPQQQDRYRVQVEKLSFFTDDFANYWPATSFSMQWQWQQPEKTPVPDPSLGKAGTTDKKDKEQPDSPGYARLLEKLDNWEIKIDSVSLKGIHDVIAGFPLKPERVDVEKVKTGIMDFQPAGEISDIQLSGQGKKLDAFSLRTRLLSVAPVKKIPGVENLSLWLAGNLQSGEARVTHEDLTIKMPRAFYKPLRGEMDIPLSWHKDEAGAYRITTGKATVVNEDATGAVIASLVAEPGQVPRLGLVGKMVNGNVANAKRYIPLKSDKIKEGAEDWLSSAFEKGFLTGGWFLHEGPVKIDPSRQQERTLQMRYDVQDTRLHFLDGWPEAEQVSASVLMNGREIVSSDVTAVILGSRLENVQLHIPSYVPGEVPILNMSGDIQGPANNVGHILKKTPIAKLIPDELQKWKFEQGDVKASLAFSWPLKKESEVQPQLHTSGQLENGILHSDERDLRITSLAGGFNYSLDNGIQIPALTGELFEHQVEGAIQTTDGVTRLQIDGQADITKVSDWLQLSWMSPASGTTDYRFQMWAGNQRVPAMRVTSSLENIVVQAPAPLKKQEEQKLPLQLDWSNASDGTIKMRFQAGKLLSGNMKLKQGQVLNGHILVGKGRSVSQQDQGLLVTGSLGQASAKQWINFIDQLQARVSKSPWSDENKPAPIQKVILSINELDLFDLAVDDAIVQVHRKPLSWNVSVNSKKIEAGVVVPDEFSLRGEYPLRVDITHLQLNQADYQGLAESGNGATSGMSPMEMPAAIVSLKNVVADGDRMGEWRFHMIPDEKGVRLEKIQGSWRYALFEGQGAWFETRQGTQESTFEGRIATANTSKLLSSWELDPLLESDDAYSLVNVAWPGNPLDISYLNVKGNASLEVGKSRITEVNRSASALRVLGVFNVSTLSRRLRLDFSDLYKKGMACDHISGDFVINGPRVSTANLHIKSPSAEFRISGEMNVETEMLNHRMDVTLPLSSNLFAGCLAGPAACAGIFVVDRLWGNKLEKMTTLGYRITGNWNDPKVKEVQGMFERNK